MNWKYNDKNIFEMKFISYVYIIRCLYCLLYLYTLINIQYNINTLFIYIVNHKHHIRMYLFVNIKNIIQIEAYILWYFHFDNVIISYNIQSIIG